tara:strand:+ start:775 stop:1347 length:573 start_codon:yes stop_codon:yes gene_type:complete
MEETVHRPLTWKGKLGTELWKIRGDLRKASLSDSEKNFEDAFAWLEWFLVTSAIVIRKLGKSGNLSEKVLSQNFSVERFDADKIPFDEMMGEKHGTLFLDPEVATGKQIGLMTIMNEFIHSSLIAACQLPENPNAISALMIGSKSRVDGNGKSHLLLVDLESILDAIEEVVRDSWNYDKNTGMISIKEEE